MPDNVLSATKRDNVGKKYAKRFRRDGKVPGIYYAHEEKEMPILFDNKELIKFLSEESSLIDLSIDKKKAKKCIVKELQLDPVTNKLLHVDIMGVKLKEKIHVTVSIHILGEAIGVKNEGGMLSHSLHDVEISCLPLDLPEHIEIDVSSLQLGESIQIKDVKLENVDILNDPDAIIASVVKVRGPKLEAEIPGEEIGEEAEDEKNASETENR